MVYGFELIKKAYIKEIDSEAYLYMHKKTGARLLSISNKDDNKVFGITFKTPPDSSTGLPHIMEHSVLCGSKKYPVKEPFAELLKGSMSTFLNAFTYPDRTCYPVASQNIKDFYNLIDVYLDAVFYPKLTKYTFMQEGWHYELKDMDSPLTINGIVYSEMKGAYSSADVMLDEYSLRSLFPDTVYRYDAGGDPKEIPNLTYEEFLEFHKRFYHPSNSFIWFYGDDDPEKRLRYMNTYLEDFNKIEIDADIPSQPIIKDEKWISKHFMAEEKDKKGMITVNWLLPDICDQKLRLSFAILEHILIGMPGSPLKKALIESGLGEDIAGVGLEKELRHLYFSTGLKGVYPDDMKKVRELIFDTINSIVKDGIDPDTIDAAVNTVEFRLRENDTGRFPRGLSLMLRALSFWIYGGDPISALSFDKELEQIKNEIKSERSYFESMIKHFFLENMHRTVLLLLPDPELKKKEEEEERRRLHEIKSKMSLSELKQIIQDVKELKKIQQSPDPPSALAKIPFLTLKDVPKENKKIPMELIEEDKFKVLFHDISTSGILYLDIGFDLKGLPQDFISYIPLIGKALIEIGTQKKDYVRVSQSIGQHTGGINRYIFVDEIREANEPCFWLFLRGKSLFSKTDELIKILKEILLIPKLDNKDRFLQIALEEKARYEKRLILSGHEVLNTRLQAHFTKSGWIREKTEGISYLFFLRDLIRRINSDWNGVLSKLESVYKWLLSRSKMILNVTCPYDEFQRLKNKIYELAFSIPDKKDELSLWEAEEIPSLEALLIKSKVNFVGKGAPLYKLGYKFHGSSLVITKYLRNSWLWNKVRVEGGAYGVYCLFDRLSGALTFLSYRDPNIKTTLESFDSSADFLKNIKLDNRELTKAIIRTIADIDMPLLPGQMGFRSLRYFLAKDDEKLRQSMREEVLSTQLEHFREFADVIAEVKEKGITKILAPKEAIEEFKSFLNSDFCITEVM